jgi:formamidopyrimidine-DNA glycosylase
VPELPDVQVYVECLDARLRGRVVRDVRVRSVFTVRTFDPPIRDLVGHEVLGFRRIGKRVVAAFDGELFLVVHLMLAGRLKLVPGGKSAGRAGLLAWDFDPRDGRTGPAGVRGLAWDFDPRDGRAGPAGVRGGGGETLLLTEAGTTRRAAVHLVRGESALAAFDAGGTEPLAATDAEIRAVLTREDHTLKRALTDPRLLAGIGNAYSDEILHRARLSPFQRTPHLDDDAWTRLASAIRTVLAEWTDRLRAEAAAHGGFPAKVTAFHEGMAVHGRHGKPCPACGAPVQRIVHGEREANYCPGCQTGGRILKDRALSRLLHDDWPKTLADL